MNMFNNLPRFVYINKEKYFIKTDYRIFISFEIEMQGKDKRKAVLNCLDKFYPAFNIILQKNLLKEAVEKFIWFYKCGKTDEEVKYNKKNSKNVRIYDYKYDSDLIWGAFWDRHIDLSKEKVHWWKFRAIWNSLSNECEFSKIRSYRAYTGKDKELLELKEFYRLPLSQFEIDEKQRRNKIFDELNRMASQK